MARTSAETCTAWHKERTGVLETSPTTTSVPALARRSRRVQNILQGRGSVIAGTRRARLGLREGQRESSPSRSPRVPAHRAFTRGYCQSCLRHWEAPEWEWVALMGTDPKVWEHGWFGRAPRRARHGIKSGRGSLRLRPRRRRPRRWPGGHAACRTCFRAVAPSSQARVAPAWVFERGNENRLRRGVPGFRRTAPSPGATVNRAYGTGRRPSGNGSRFVGMDPKVWEHGWFGRASRRARHGIKSGRGSLRLRPRRRRPRRWPGGHAACRTCFRAVAPSSQARVAPAWVFERGNENRLRRGVPGFRRTAPSPGATVNRAYGTGRRPSGNGWRLWGRIRKFGSTDGSDERRGVDRRGVKSVPLVELCPANREIMTP